MENSMKKFVAGLFAAAVAFAAHASDPETLAVMAKLKEKYPSTTFSSVERAPIAGMFEVSMGKNIAYTDRDLRYFLFGSMYDMVTQQDLTASKRQAMTKIDWNELPLKDALVTVKGNGSRKVAVFSDPDCPYCRKLENELMKMTNVTIYTFMFPIDSLHPQARKKAESIWCAKDAANLWAKHMTENATVPSANCDNPVGRNVALAGKLGINGTPYLIAQDGRSLPGMAPADRLDSFLNSGK
jgi:thiol:disulfide interchange protein DsbC